MTTPKSAQLTALSDPNAQQFERVDPNVGGFTPDEIMRLLNGEPVLDAPIGEEIDVVDDVVVDESVIVAAANDDKYSGGMIALIPSEADLDRLALDGYEPREDLHLTLWYLGDEDIDVEDRVNITAAVSQVSSLIAPVEGKAFGAALWNPEGEKPAWVLNVGDEHDDDDEYEGSRLVDVRALVASGLADFDMPDQHTPWQPHICIAYSDEDLLDAVSERVGPVTFDRVRIAFGRDIIDVQLGLPVMLASSSGGGPVQWHIVENHADCGEDGPFAVVQDGADGEALGCHDSEASAQEHIAELRAEEGEDDNTEEGKKEILFTEKSASFAAAPDVVPEGHVRVGDGSYMTQAEFETARRWSGTLVVEGITTGDGREFSPEALSWVENPLIRWQKETAHGGDHDVTVTVGRADRVWRENEKIQGEGVLDIVSPDGFEIYRRMRDGFAGGISIDADDIADADVEVVWPKANEEMDADEAVQLLFGKPEKLIFNGGRVRAATIVDIPAFVEAKIALIGDSTQALVAAATDGEVVTGAPVEPSYALTQHTTALSDKPWTRVRQKGFKRTAPLGAYAWGHGDIALHMHHELFKDGTIGAANLTACSAAIAELAAGRGLIPESDERAVYEHLAGHLRDANLVPPPFPKLDALSASIDAMEDRRPPKEWFKNPNLSVPVGITITDEGRIYGHAAQWGECHIGFEDTCVGPPVESAHPYFMTGEVVTADGSRVAVGQITVATGHAPLNMRASRAAEHYDNTGSAVADVVVGNDEIGIWVAGAIRPHAEAQRVHDLRASGRVSGDWRRIGGELRMVGLLGVNVPGFALRTRARVASGVPQSLVAAGLVTIGNMSVPEVMTDAAKNADAMKRVLGMLNTRVHGGGE